MKRTQKGQSNGPSQRQLRVGELFRHRLCEVFARNDVRDLDLDTRTITVTEVSASPIAQRHRLRHSAGRGAARWSVSSTNVRRCCVVK